MLHELPNPFLTSNIKCSYKNDKLTVSFIYEREHYVLEFKYYNTLGDWLSEKYRVSTPYLIKQEHIECEVPKIRAYLNKCILNGKDVISTNDVNLQEWFDKGHLHCFGLFGWEPEESDEDDMPPLEKKIEETPKEAIQKNMMPEKIPDVPENPKFTFYTSSNDVIDSDSIHLDELCYRAKLDNYDDNYVVEVLFGTVLFPNLILKISKDNKIILYIGLEDIICSNMPNWESNMSVGFRDHMGIKKGINNLSKWATIVVAAKCGLVIHLNKLNQEYVNKLNQEYVYNTNRSYYNVITSTKSI